MDHDSVLFAAGRSHYRGLLKQAAAERLVREVALAVARPLTGQAVVVPDICKLAELIARIKSDEAPASGWFLNLSIYRSSV